MKSHSYNFNFMDLSRLIGRPLIPVLIFAAAMHLGAAFNLLPKPALKLGVDQTILVHQAEASQARHEADLVLIGDSSCLMDCSASYLQQLLPHHKTLNLGTLSYFDLRIHADLVRRFAQANPNQLRAVVLLEHPQMLRGVTWIPYHADFLELVFQQADYHEKDSVYGCLSFLVGIDVFRGRLLGRFLPIQLPHYYGYYYGFTTTLNRHMTQHHGSAVDPRRYVARPAQGKAEYQLSPNLELASRSFKQALPAGVKLIVGITPVPQSSVAADYHSLCHETLLEWSKWLGADGALAELPTTLPDSFFATEAHLNESGSKAYTRMLAQSLAPMLH